MKITVNFFWAYGSLSRLERLAINSFIYHGFDVTLWSYDRIANIPPACQLRDAREILPEDLVFLNGKKSYASFADLFRYALLTKVGGLYADTDVICLKPAELLPRQAFLVTEQSGTRKYIKNFLRKLLGISKPDRVNNNVIFNPAPSPGNVIDLAYHYSQHFPKDKIKWSEIGPKLLSAIVAIYPNHGYTIYHKDFANPVSQHDCPHLLLKNHALPDSAFFLHCYNEKWRQANMDKNAAYPEASLLGKLEKLYADAGLD